MLCCLTLSHAAARPCRMCWITHENCNDPLQQAERRTVAKMKELTAPIFKTLKKGNRAARGDRLKAKRALWKISAKALVPSTWDFSFGESAFGMSKYSLILI